MKKLLSVLIASAMLCVPAMTSASASDSNCKIKDILSNISQYVTCTNEDCSEKSCCNILDMLRGIGEKTEISVQTDIADKLFGFIADRMNVQNGGKNENITLPEDDKIDIPADDHEDEQDHDKIQTPASDVARQITDLVNSYRTQYGISPVSYDETASCAAQKRAVEIETLFSHTRPDGSRCFTALDECGASYRGAGENIAMGQMSAEQVMTDWMNSKGHRENILNESFTKLGVGFYTGADGRYYWTQMFIY